MIRKVTFEEANDLLSARPDITLVDVREEPDRKSNGDSRTSSWISTLLIPYSAICTRRASSW